VNRLDFIESPHPSLLSADPHAEALSPGRESGLREALEAYEKALHRFRTGAESMAQGKVRIGSGHSRSDLLSKAQKTSAYLSINPAINGIK